MPPDDATPDSPIERARLLQNILVARATAAGPGDEVGYNVVRQTLIEDQGLRALLPEFVRTCRTLGQFWAFISGQAGTYQERRQIIWTGFAPIFDHLEGRHRTPVDLVASPTLTSFDPDGVRAYWERALQRRNEDPEGAITLARTLLETVCKQILDELHIAYRDAEELPMLYGKVAAALNLAPSQHTEESFRVILGSCQQVVERLGTLRNRIGDAHGRGVRPVRPQARHASLAVNLSGAMATFIIETYQARTSV